MPIPIARRAALPGLAALLAAPALPAAWPAAAQGGLGLAERRAIAAYRDGVFPDLLARIKAAAGTDLEVEVGWERIALPGQADQYAKPAYWTNLYFVPLISALAAVTGDAMGREAVKAKLRRVVVAYDPATAPASNYPNGLRFADGTLTVNWHPNSNVNDLAERTAAIRTVLEAGL
jgi:hypothetical protein